MYILKSTSTYSLCTTLWSPSGFYILFLEPIQSSKFAKPQIINFTTNNPYVSNLNKLMGDLAYKLMALILVQWVSNTTKHMGLLFVVVMSQKLIVLPVLLRQDK